MSLSRRTLLKYALATSVLSGLNACSERKEAGSESSSNVLNIYSWPDYLHPDTIPNFEKRYGIKVIYDTVASNEALLAKFQAGAAKYDIIVPTGYVLSKLTKLGKLQEIDHAKLSNFKNLMPRFQDPGFDPGCRYSIPYTFGTTGIAFNTRAFSRSKLPTDWPTLFDQNPAAGRMTFLEDARETIGAALKSLGYSLNSTNEKELERAFQVLKEQKPSTMCYTSDQVIVYLASGDSLLSLAYSGDAKQASRSNTDVEYIIPQGGASVWVDNLCIPKEAPNPENAYLWINYILEPEVSAMLSNYTYYATPNMAARKYINADLLRDRTLYPPDSVLDRCEELKDIGQGIFLYDRLWTELKCV